MKTMYRILLLIFLVTTRVSVNFAQELSGTIRGTITEEFTNVPLTGATVILEGSDPLIGVTTDTDGNFVLPHIAVGRVNLQITFIGYKDRYLQNVEVLNMKETVLHVVMEQSAIELSEVKVSYRKNKNETLNPFSTVSARPFTVEETSLYAGSLGDPARMAGNFAGVLTVDDSRNDIVIRGNSPNGLLWRLDGFDIPNPNHYSMPGSAGGPMSMLNHNNLATSDFLTGAFPAEYGNALSGVFDLQLRSGNAEKHEHVFQLANSGFELGSEGPVKIGKASSYIINYRYSAPKVFDLAGLWDEPYLPEYQDLTFKANIANTKAGNFQLFMLGGTNGITQDSRKIDSTDWSYGLIGSRMRMDNKMGVVGLTHTYYFSDNSRIITKLSFQDADNSIKIDSVASEENLLPKTNISSVENKIIYRTLFKTKLNARNFITIGGTYEFCTTDFSIIETVYNNEPPEKTIDIDENTNSLAAFAQYKHKFSDKLSITMGSRYYSFLNNNTYSFEPRFGIEYQLSAKQSLGFGYGIHSQKQSNAVYFLESYDYESNEYVLTNKDLDMTKSTHYVLSYNNLISPNLNLKIETYYQDIRNAPVTHKHPQYSLLNDGGAFSLPSEDSLENKGTGQNYGLELTLEKYLSDNYYFLLTGSLFQSKYAGYDKITRNTEFNSNYALNALFGYNLRINEKYTVGVNIRGIYTGGKRELPIDLEASEQKGETVYDWSHAYEHRFPDYYRIDGRLSLKEYHKKYMMEFAIDITNITDYTGNIIGRYYNSSTGKIATDYQSGRQLNFFVRVYF